MPNIRLYQTIINCKYTLRNRVGHGHSQRQSERCHHNNLKKYIDVMRATGYENILVFCYTLFILKNIWFLVALEIVFIVSCEFNWYWLRRKRIFLYLDALKFYPYEHNKVVELAQDLAPKFWDGAGDFTIPRYQRLRPLDQSTPIEINNLIFYVCIF